MTVTLPGLEDSTEQRLEWGNDVVRVVVAHGPHTAPRLVALWHTGEARPDVDGQRRSALPVLEVAVLGDGRSGTSGKRHVDGAAAQRMRLTGTEQDTDEGGVRHLRLCLADPESGLRAVVHYEVAVGIPVLRTWAELTSDRELVLDHVTTGVVAGLGHAARWEHELAVWEAANPWSGEFRWRRSTLAERGLYDVGMVRFGQVGSKNRISLTSTGAWSTSEHLAMGLVEDTRTGRLLAWQVETSGAWHAELGDRYDDVYLAVMGPTAHEHHWAGHLDATTRFTSVPVSLAVVPGAADGPEATLDAVGAALTAHRRRTRRQHPDHEALPVVYNDFLNALMSDPTTERELPLIEAAADLGAEYYVIDAGWYDDEQGGWWDSVGQWEPSTTRFPDGGLGGIVDRIRAHGMQPGLWLEPEVVGVRSPVARTLPDAAFFQRHGHRVTEWGRHQLDLRHTAAREHLDTVIDRLVSTFGLAYLKLDHNIDIGPGTDAGTGTAPGTGLLEHGRAFLAWASAVMDRHPGLVIEACAAGGSRTDPASGSVFPVQSVTDQQDYRATPPIAAAAPLALPPEQTGVWASVDGTMDREPLAFSLVTALLARVHLTGRVDTLDAAQRAVVREALAAYRAIRSAVGRSVPVWPLGLPGWRDPWIVQGARDGEHLYLAVWRRGGQDDGAPDTLRVPLPGRVADEAVEVLYPRWGGESVTVADDGRVLELKLPALTSARLLRVRVGS
ncbi:alpha-galactosidase [Promicromonospora umidemergens]|uniref:Alpha-galactosidase n=1 Tax=Promicromonospora umidemergens TaxID=629679 RepID=A0ABP8WHZ5_9MICO|nr:alpha-galactosidase [Promicromonospora umidemergens]MCP2283845.1 alpha-galactosidase [Promicromonospora umidemergens]